MIAVFSHQEIKTFVQESLKTKGPFKVIYLILATVSGVILGGMLGFSITTWITQGTAQLTIQVVLGLVFSFSILIVIHEWIHGLTYKFFGAKNVYYGCSLKKFVFYAASDGDVVNARQFRIIALAPFVVISTLCLILMAILPTYFFCLATILFSHILFCGGDFAFIHFMTQYDMHRLHTHDDRKKEETYFYYLD